MCGRNCASDFGLRSHMRVHHQPSSSNSPWLMRVRIVVVIFDGHPKEKPLGTVPCMLRHCAMPAWLRPYLNPGLLDAESNVLPLKHSPLHLCFLFEDYAIISLQCYVIQNGSEPMSEADQLTSMAAAHSTFMSVISHRHRSLRIIRSEWMSKGPKVICNVALLVQLVLLI